VMKLRNWKARNCSCQRTSKLCAHLLMTMLTKQKSRMILLT